MNNYRAYLTSIYGLNHDCLQHIFRYCMHDAYNLSMTCTLFRDVCEMTRLFNTLKITACCPHPDDNVNTIAKFSHMVEVFGHSVRNIILKLKNTDVIDGEFIKHIAHMCPELRYLELGHEIPRNLIVEMCHEIFPKIERLVMRRRDVVDWQAIAWNHCAFDNLRELSLYDCQGLDMAELNVFRLEKLVMHSCRMTNFRGFLERNGETLHSLVLGHNSVEEDFKQLGLWLPNLKMLSLAGMQVQYIGPNLHNLRDLRVANCEHVTSLLFHVAALNRLESLCYHQRFDDNVYINMLKHITTLKSLTLSVGRPLGCRNTQFIVESLYETTIEHLLLTDISLQSLKNLISVASNLQVVAFHNLNPLVTQTDLEDMQKDRPELVFHRNVMMPNRQPDNAPPNNEVEDEIVDSIDGLTMERFEPHPLPCRQGGRCQTFYEIHSDDLCQKYLQKDSETIKPITVCHAHCCTYHKLTTI